MVARLRARGRSGWWRCLRGRSRPAVVMRLDGPVLADDAGQILGAGVSAGQAGDGVDGLAGGLAGGVFLPPPADLDGLPGAGKSRRLT